VSLELPVEELAQFRGFHYNVQCGLPCLRKNWRSRTLALDEFSSITRFRVAFCDIDMLQHVNNAAYLVWAETARCVYFDEVLHESLKGTAGMVVARLEMHYERALTYRERVAVGCRVTRIGRKSFDFLFEFWSEDTRQRAAYCHQTLVAFNFETNSSVPVPARWREIIAAHEVVQPEMAAADHA
jgi:acyl-CoA thioester hydrolase